MSEHHYEPDTSPSAGPDARRRQERRGGPPDESGTSAGAAPADDRGAEAGGVAYAAHLDAFGRELRRVAARRRWRRTRPLVVAGAGGLVAAAAVFALVSSPGTGPVDVVARAEAALAPRGELLHYVVRTSVGTATVGALAVTPQRDGCLPSSPSEVWQTTDPPRWRMVYRLSTFQVRCGRQRDRHGRNGGARQEIAYADGTTTTYTRERGSLDTIRGYAPTSSAAGVPIGSRELGGGDPVSAVRRMLADGKLHDRGERVLAGRPVRMLTGRRVERNRAYRWVRETTYLVDATSFEPVRAIQLLIRRVPAGRGGLKGFTLRTAGQLDFERFERRRLDAAGERKLVIQPGRIIRRTDVTQEQLRQQRRRQRQANERRAERWRQEQARASQRD